MCSGLADTVVGPMSRVGVLALVGSLALSAACSDQRSEQGALVGVVYTPAGGQTLDLLLVIDDSGSMADQQQLASTNLGAFAGVLDTVDFGVDARIAITTTSVPGPTCVGALARGGELLTDTCRAAPSEAFLGPSEVSDTPVDHSGLCELSCALESLELRPSPLDDYAEELAIRPWIELGNNSYGGNLPDGVSGAQALSCAALRGFGGCEFESPLAAAMRALDHMRSPGDPAYGFLRDDTPLMILFIGDEDDCSHTEASATIFDPAGERVFWSDPNAAAPSSAVCHAAGTACDADGCVPVDRDLQGAETSDYEAAVLRSLVEFRAKLDTLALERPLAVSVLGGAVPGGSLVWSDGDDPAWVDEFGTGPGCEGAGGERAQPPGRLAALSTSNHGVLSICEPDWTPVFLDLASGPWPEQLRPFCGPLVEVADANPLTPALEPDCEVLVRTAVNELWPVPACERDADGFIIDPETNDYSPPAGAERCYALLTDLGQDTSDPYDDLGPECSDDGHLLQVKISVLSGTLPLPRASVYELVCALGI